MQHTITERNPTHPSADETLNPLPFEDREPLSTMPAATMVPHERTELPLIVFEDQLRDVPVERDTVRFMRTFGQLRPAIVEFEGEDTYIMHAGQHDTRALMEIAHEDRAPLDERTVWCSIYADGDWRTMPLLTLAAHTAPADPVSEFRAVERLLASGATDTAIAEHTGISRTTIRKRQKLLRLLPELRRGFERGQIAVTVAERAAGLPVEAQSLLVDTLAATGRVTRRDVQHAKRAASNLAIQLLDPEPEPDDRLSDNEIRALIADCEKPDPPRLNDSVALALDELLRWRAGTSVPFEQS